MEYSVFSRRRFVGSLTTLPYPARLAWDIVLYEAEKLRGRVFLPPFDLASAAVITIEEARDALASFQQPDPNSATEAEEGRRLIPIAGEPHWYKVVTWEEHERERAAYFNRLRQQRWYAKNAEKQPNDDLTVPNGAKRDLTKEPEPEPELDSSSPKKEKVGSKTTSSSARKETDDDAAEDYAEIVTEVIRRLCPQMKGLQRRNVLGWLDDYRDKGPWWISAALMEGNGTMASARSPGYITRTLRSRLDDEFSCPEAESFVRHRLRCGVTVAEIAEFQKQRQKPDGEATK